MGKKEKQSDYAVYKIPRELDEEVTKVVGKHGYRSKTEFAKDAIRQLLQKFPERNLAPIPLSMADAVIIGFVGVVLTLVNPVF